MQLAHTPAARRTFLMALTTVPMMLMACGGGDNGSNTPPPPPPPPPGPVTLARASASGNAQTGVVGGALATPIRVMATRDAQPVSGITVTWSTSGTGASMSPLTSVTDAQGIAATTWTLAQNAGAKNASATVSGATGSPVAFTATATAGPATKIALLDGNNQAGTISTLLGLPLRVAVSDQYDNPVAGASIVWTVLSGGGAMGSGTTQSNAFGAGTGSWTLGTAVGTQTSQASSAGLAGSPITFTATATAPPVGLFAVTVGNDFFTPGTPTVPVGTAVTWTWTGTGIVPHSVRSTGVPSFTSSATLTGSGQTYSFTFTAPGVYTYDCAVHGALMTGTITVQ